MTTIYDLIAHLGNDPDTVVRTLRSKREHALGNETFVQWLKRPSKKKRTR